jgi:hypothetical protein
MLKLKISHSHWPLFLALALTLAASGQDNKRQQSAPAQSTAAEVQSAPAAARGVRVFIDPLTGAIREPEQEELQAASIDAATQASALPEPVTHASGAEGMLLGEDQMVYSIATIGPGGKIEMEHVTGEKNAEAKVKAQRKEASDVR